MKKFLLFTFTLCISTVAFGTKFPGSVVAHFYNEAMSIPKGWELVYIGKELGVHVFNMKRNFDEHPQSRNMSVKEQMVRLMCNDVTLRNMMAQGIKVRAHSIDTENTKARKKRGGVLSACPK